MVRQRREANNHNKKDYQKENEKSLESKPEHMEIHNINDRDFTTCSSENTQRDVRKHIK